MTSTTITLNAEHRLQRATGYNTKLLALPPWAGGVMDSTGSINSTAADMLKFGAAMVDSNSPLKAAFARMTSVRRPSDGPRSDQVLGWGIFKLGSTSLSVTAAARSVFNQGSSWISRGNDLSSRGSTTGKASLLLIFGRSRARPDQPSVAVNLLDIVTPTLPPLPISA